MRLLGFCKRVILVSIVDTVDCAMCGLRVDDEDGRERRLYTIALIVSLTLGRKALSVYKRARTRPYKDTMIVGYVLQQVREGKHKHTRNLFVCQERQGGAREA